jgi:ATP-binding cassette, subfamily F, member 3
MLAGFQHLTFEFGARTIVKDIDWHIQPNERIGLIGYNGTGKSTLLKLFAGEYQPTEGTVERSRSTTIGFLHQDLLSFETDESILSVALSAFERILQLEKEIEELGRQIESASASLHLDKGASETLIHQYSDKLHEMDLLDGYSIHHRTEEVLQGLGFANADLQNPFRELSGGWRMRVLLARMILQKPDLLLLDEPTNHLDLPSIEWLEKYLQHYPGSVVIVSHDKYFLNRMVTKIVELYQQSLHIYNGDYSFYEFEKQQRISVQQRAYDNQQEYIRQQERFIERFRAKATKAAAAQSAIKRLDKLERIEDVELERPNIRINFSIDKTPGKVLASLKQLSKSFGKTCILKEASAEIDRGDKIALIGANGKGKSTLLRIIAGTESFEGERIWGHQVEESFYAQHQLEALDLNHTVLEEMKSAGSRKSEVELRTLLGCFLFSGDEVEKKVRVLSGGEKARVALAKTMVSKANFLLLDEPTNHLDIHSCDLLIEALEKYEGTHTLVSHDRYFVSKTANKIWEILDGQIKEFKGGFEEWAAWKQRQMEKERDANGLSSVGTASSGKQSLTAAPPEAPKIQGGRTGTPLAPTPNAVAEPKGSINKEIKKEYQKQQRIFQQLEIRIMELKGKAATLEAALTDPSVYADKNRFVQVENDYKNAAAELDRANGQYEQVFDRILNLEKKLTH